LDAAGEFASPEHLNYFNYFTEVEDEFVRRRGKHLLVSPMDWALVESWKDAGIPLTVVIRGISRAFDAFEARPATSRKINSILYCEQAVEETYAEYQLAMVGGSPPDSAATEEAPARPPRRSAPQASSFTREALLEFLDRCQAELAGALRWLTERSASNDGAGSPASPTQAATAIERARTRLAEIRGSIADTGEIDPEATEVDLSALDTMLFEQLSLAYGPEVMESLRVEAQAQLKGYRSKMEKSMYERTLDNFIGKRLRSICRVPRLSLFYI